MSTYIFEIIAKEYFFCLDNTYLSSISMKPELLSNVRCYILMVMNECSCVPVLPAASLLRGNLAGFPSKIVTSSSRHKLVLWI